MLRYDCPQHLMPQARQAKRVSRQCLATTPDGSLLFLPLGNTVQVWEGGGGLEWEEVDKRGE